MGTKHRGWIIKWRGDRVQCRVARPGLASYDTRTFDSEDEANTWGRRRRAELILDPEAPRGPKRLPKAILTTEDIGERQRARMALDGLSPGHIANLKVMHGQIASLVPDLAAPSARDVIQKWLDSKPRAPRSHNRILAQLRGLVSWAKQENYLVAAADPLRGIAERKVPNENKEQLTLTEMRTLLSQGADHLWLLVAIMIYTGTRRGEALAFHWEDVEFDASGRGVLVLRKRPGMRLKTGERIIPLQAELRAILEPVAKKSGPVVPRSANNVRRTFMNFLEVNGCLRPGITPHSCRHSYVGMLTATGEPVGVVRLSAGHKKDDQTHYYGSAALRYRNDVETWRRGELRIMEGVTSKWPRPKPATMAERVSRSMRESAKVTGPRPTA